MKPRAEVESPQSVWGSLALLPFLVSCSLNASGPPASRNGTQGRAVATAGTPASHPPPTWHGDFGDWIRIGRI